MRSSRRLLKTTKKLSKIDPGTERHAPSFFFPRIFADHLLEEGENLIQMARDKIRRSAKPAEMSLADAVEEVVADACEEMLGNTKYAEMMAQENPTLAQSIKSWITDFVEKIKTAVSPDARRHREAEVMRKFAAELQELWDKALVGATSASRSEESGAARSEELGVKS